MADLRRLLEECGFVRVVSVLHSGNLVFDVSGQDCERLEEELAERTFSRLGLRTDFIIRTSAEMDQVVLENPYAREAELDPSHLVVVFLQSAPDATAASSLASAPNRMEQVTVLGKHAYIVYPDGIGTSKLTLRLVESVLGCSGTARNWNTVQNLANACKA